MAFGKEDAKKSRFLSGDFSSHVSEAIEAMSRFNPPMRMRARIMVEKNFIDFENISNINIEDKDFDEQKKLVELKLTVAAKLPDLIKQLEEGFGIRTQKEVDEKGRQPSFADNIHDLMESQNN